MAQPAGKDSVSVASSCPPDNIRPAEERLEQKKNSGDDKSLKKFKVHKTTFRQNNFLMRHFHRYQFTNKHIRLTPNAIHTKGSPASSVYFTYRVHYRSSIDD